MKNTINYNPTTAPVSVTAMRDTTISIGARGMLALLMTHAKTWSFNRYDIMKKIGCGKVKYDRIRSELVDAGYLSIKPNHNNKTNRLDGYSWYLYSSPQENPNYKSLVSLFPAHQKTSIAENQPTRSQGHISSESNKNESNKKKSNKKNIQKDSIKDDFNLLWDSENFKKIIPSKCRSGKSHVFDRLKKRNYSTKEGVIEILTACIKYYNSDETKDKILENRKKGNNDGDFIKQLPTIINQGLYEDFINIKTSPFEDQSEDLELELRKLKIDFNKVFDHTEPWEELKHGKQPEIVDGRVKLNGNQKIIPELESWFNPKFKIWRQELQEKRVNLERMFKDKKINIDKLFS